MIRELFEMVGKGAPAPAFTEAEWRDLLAFADRTQLTLHLSGTPGLPAWLREEVESRYARNAERRRRLRDAYTEVADALTTAEIDFVLLKGFTHEAPMWGRSPTQCDLLSRIPTSNNCSGADPLVRAGPPGPAVSGGESTAGGQRPGRPGGRPRTLGSAPPPRVQYDLDLLTLPGDVARARTVIERLGYAPHGAQSLSEEHSRPLVRPSTWTWRGDYFDPEMPIPVELHGSVWSAQHDRIHPAGMEDFWNRRCLINVNGLQIPAFAEVDRLGFAALHALRHILRHDARPAHVLELARFLEGASSDGNFWDRWRDVHPPELRALQTIAFRFAHEWFGCALPAADVAQALVPAVSRLVSTPVRRADTTSKGLVGRSACATSEKCGVEAWFHDFAWSPVANLTRPNKDTVWLHVALVENWRDRIRVFGDRMIPLRLPQYEGFLGRLRYHASALAPALASGVRWWWRRDAASTASEISDWKRRSV